MVYINTTAFLLLMRYAFNQWGKENLEKADKAFLWVGSVILALLTGLRHSVTGSDTSGYIAGFKQFRKLPWSSVIDDSHDYYEIGYRCLIKIIGYITNHENVFFTILALFFAYSLGKFITKNSKNRFLSLMLYFTVGAFSFQITGVRQSLAMAILLFSFEYIKERKLVKFLITVVIASLFHQSAIAIIPMYFLAYVKMNLISFSLFLLGGSIGCVYASSLMVLFQKIFDKYEVYSATGFEGGAFFVVLMYIITIVVSYMFMNSLEKQYKHNVFFFNMTFVSLLLYILRYFVTIAERVGFYYQFAFIILLPNVIEAIPDNKTRRTVRTCALILACLLFAYRSIRAASPEFRYYFFWQ